MFYRIGSSSRNCGSDVIWGPKTSKSAKKGREREREREMKKLWLPQKRHRRNYCTQEISKKSLFCCRKKTSLSFSLTHTLSLFSFSLRLKKGREREEEEKIALGLEAVVDVGVVVVVVVVVRVGGVAVGDCLDLWNARWKKEENTHGLFCYNLKQSTY